VKARTRSYPVVEQYGMIFMYRDAAGSKPQYALPEMDDFDPAEWTRPATFDFEIRIHGQDIMENSVDSPHFMAVHGHDMPINTFHAEGKQLRITQHVRAYRFRIPMKARL
jgi:phenylpropionate dioxygenase-like ring-hydroxylating dioxygenase large terminal subunit